MLHYFVLLFVGASADPQRDMHKGSKLALLVENRHINSGLEISEGTERHELLVHSEQQCMMKCAHFGYEECISIEKSTAVKS